MSRPSLPLWIGSTAVRSAPAFFSFRCRSRYTPNRILGSCRCCWCSFGARSAVHIVFCRRGSSATGILTVYFGTHFRFLEIPDAFQQYACNPNRPPLSSSLSSSFLRPKQPLYCSFWSLSPSAVWSYSPSKWAKSYKISTPLHSKRCCTPATELHRWVAAANSRLKTQTRLYLRPNRLFCGCIRWIGCPRAVFSLWPTRLRSDAAFEL